MHLERNYILFACSNLPRFKQKSSDLFNFRCSICGDSETNKARSRAYVYAKNGNYRYHCHNCQADMPFKVYLKKYHHHLYEEYLKESLKERYSKKEVSKPLILNDKKHEKSIFSSLTRISDLPSLHPAKVYLNERFLPKTYYDELFFCSNFKGFTNNLLPDKYMDFTFDESRIIIPLVNQFGNVYGYQGRTIDPKNDIRYITILLNENSPRLYGLHKLNFNIKVWVFEGPFDSMFIPNSIASCGGNIITDLKTLNVEKSNITISYDNEPRNRDIISNIGRAIDNGYSVVIWPDSLKFKDVNEMIENGLTSYEIVDIMEKNTFKGLSGQMRLSKWAKI